MEKLTHINIAFVGVNSNGSIMTSNVEPALITRAHTSNVKVLISLQGSFADATNSTNRAAFVSSLKSYIVFSGVDGVDIDWEFPTSATDKSNLTAFVQELRTALPDKLITMAIGTSSTSNQYVDFLFLTPLVDWYNVMYYDYNGAGGVLAGHNAPLYSGYSPGSVSSIAWTHNYLTATRGIPTSKLVFGAPFYGLYWGDSETIYDPCSASCGGQNYYSIIAPIVGNGWTSYIDPKAGAPYIRKDSGVGLYTYDDPTSISLKTQWAMDHGYSGVMMWHLAQDYSNGQQPLLDAIVNTLNGGDVITPTISVTTMPTMTMTFTPTATATATPSLAPTSTLTLTPVTPTLTPTRQPTKKATKTRTPTPTKSAQPITVAPICYSVEIGGTPYPPFCP